MNTITCQMCGVPTVWELVVTVDETEHGRDLFLFMVTLAFRWKVDVQALRCCRS